MQRLFDIAAKKKKRILGLMSGTSMDGLDIAWTQITGSGPQTRVELQAFMTKTYPEEVREKLRRVVSVEEVPMQELCILNDWLGNYHATLILEALETWGLKTDEIDCIASHGQTIYHAPARFHEQEGAPNATLQIGDGDHIAYRTGILTLSDFRQKHIAAGEEGAPLVALTDNLLYRDAQKRRVLLNIGGIANFTYLPQTDDQISSVVTTDTGPGNTLIDHAMQVLFNQPYDKDGEVASRGSVHPGLLKQLVNHPFFSKPIPRTTGPELFNIQWVRRQQQASGTQQLSGEDLVATLTWFSAQTIVDVIKAACNGMQPEVYLSGGGLHNRQLVEWIEELLDQKTHSFETIGFNPDAKEAVCFAALANETLSGRGFSIRGTENIHLGKISLPG